MGICPLEFWPLSSERFTSWERCALPDAYANFLILGPGEYPRPHLRGDKYPCWERPIEGKFETPKLCLGKTPILKDLKQWTLEQYPTVLPKSLIGKALDYYIQREERLSRYIQDGRLEIDNNFVENSIRPLALGRKNYLFAGSHKAAQHAAIIYSFIGSCEKVGIEPRPWLTDVIERIPNTSIQNLDQLLPNNWEPKSKNL